MGECISQCVENLTVRGRRELFKKNILSWICYKVFLLSLLKVMVYKYSSMRF
jgi:hypothetical protein